MLGLRFRRSLAFAHAGAVISDKTRSVRATEPPRDSFRSKSLGGDYDLNPLFDAPAKPVKINNSHRGMLLADGLLWESSIPELKGRLCLAWHSIGQSTGLSLSFSQITSGHWGLPI
jgi:hypothetical protein